MDRDKALELMREAHNWPYRNFLFKTGKGPNPGKWENVFMWAELTLSAKWKLAPEYW